MGTPPGHNPGTDEWVGLVEAAARLGMSVDTVRRRVKRGELDGRKLHTQQGFKWQVRLGTPPTQPMQDAGPAEQAEPRAIVSDQARQQLEAIRDEWLLPLVRENGDLRERIGHLEAERDALAARVAALQARGGPESHAEDVQPIVSTPAPWWARLTHWRRR